MTSSFSTLRGLSPQAPLFMLAAAILTALICLTETAAAGQQRGQANISLGSSAPDSRSPVNDQRTKDNGQLSIDQTAFTYQGQLKDSNGPVNGAYDLQFGLYSAQTGGEKLGVKEIQNSVLTNGLFKFQLDFGRAVEAKESWLEIGVRPSGSAEAYTVLFPRQKLTPTPYAIFAQHEQWSLIGVPVGFAGHEAKPSLLTDANTNQEVTHAKRTTEERLISGDSLKGKAADAESKTAAPNGVEWTRDGAGNLFPTNFGDKVGIGTATPGEKLHVAQSGNYQLRLENPAAGGGFWSIGQSDNTFNIGGGRLAFVPNSTNSSNATVVFANSGEVTIGNVLRLNNLGCAAGIGVVSPLSCTNYMLVGQTNGNTFINSSSAGHIHFRHNNVEADQMEIQADGTVNIANTIHLNNLGCAAGIGVVAPFNCSNYMLVGQTNGNTFVNSSGAGNIHFRHNNIEADQMEIRADGTTAVRVLQILGGSDVSEQFDVTVPDIPGTEPRKDVIDPGTVVAIDPVHPGKLVVSQQAYDHRVAGIVSGAGGVKPGMVMGQEGTVADGGHPVALSGRVYCWADASNGRIEPGDFLTTSDTPGHAMKVKNHKKAQGAIIGKAMTGLERGKGLVLVLVMPQ